MLCECGCGQPAPVATYSHASFGWVKGQPKRFISGHNTGRMEEHPRWAGGRNPDGKGYMRVTVAPKKWVYEHRLVAEQMLGRSLEPGEVVHHIDGNGMNNDPENLRIVSQAEHLRLHPRKRQEFCKHGHPFAGENLRIDNRGHRVCRTRNIERSRRWKEAHAV